MKEKKNPSQLKILEIILLLILIPIIVSVLSHYILMFSPSAVAIICLLSFLVVLVVYQQFQLKNVIDQLNATGGIVELFSKTLGGVSEKILQLPQNKRVMGGDLLRVFVLPLNKFFQDVSRAYTKSVLKSSSPKEREEIRRLMKKANRGEITYEEAKRLKRLLEEEKKKYEDAGDTLGAIILGLLLLSILGLLAGLLLKKR